MTPEKRRAGRAIRKEIRRGYYQCDCEHKTRSTIPIMCLHGPKTGTANMPPVPPVIGTWRRGRMPR